MREVAGGGRFEAAGQLGQAVLVEAAQARHQLAHRADDAARDDARRTRTASSSEMRDDDQQQPRRARSASASTPATVASAEACTESCSLSIVVKSWSIAGEISPDVEVARARSGPRCR